MRQTQLPSVVVQLLISLIFVSVLSFTEEAFVQSLVTAAILVPLLPSRAVAGQRKTTASYF